MNNKNGLNLYISLFLLTVLLFSLLTVYAAASVRDKKPSVGAKAAVLYEPETESFLYEKEADLRLPMASTTKIMTALVTLESAEPSDTVVIDGRAVGIEGSSAYLREGDEYTVEELLYALMLGSANDAAVALACHISDGTEEFAELMNERARSLSLTDTHFENPHGLDGKEHYTTAKELSLIAAEAMKNDVFRQIVATYKRTFTHGERVRTYVNHNKLLKMFEGAAGVKTGFTKSSGRCLVGAAERGGLTMITVTLDDPCDWQDHGELFDYGYSLLEKITLCDAGEYVYRLPLTDGDTDGITVSNTEGTSVIVPTGEHRVSEYVKLPKFTAAPVTEGEVLGEVVFTVDGEYAGSVRLMATETAPVKAKQNLFDKILSFFK